MPFDINGQPDHSKRKPRGKSKKTLILDAIKDAALLELSEGSTREEAEQAVFKFMAEAAFNPTVETALMSNFCLGQLMKKGWPDLKAVMPCVEFEFDKDGDVNKQASQILDAAASGILPPDVAHTFITSITSMMKIEEVTEIKERLDKIEDALNGQCSE